MEINLDSATKYHEGKFPPQELDHGKLMPSLLEATEALARYDQALKAMHNSEIFLAPLRGQESLASSRMEGTYSTLEEIMQLSEETGEGDPLSVAQEYRSETVETYLYGRALTRAQRSMEEGYPLSESLIKSMHQLLLSYGRGTQKSPGQYKQEQNYIGGAGEVSFIPIAPELLDSAMQRMIKFSESDQTPPLLRVALCHLEFEALHPFKDGNGRVGRMLITLMLWKYGVISSPHFYISRYFEEHKADYVNNLRMVSAENQWTEWCIFFFRAVQTQAQQNLTITQAISNLYDDMKVKFTDALASRWSTQALDYIFTNPVFRNSKFTSNAGIPSNTAARFTRKLLEVGLISVRQEASGRQSAVYSFEPLLNFVKG